MSVKSGRRAGWFVLSTMTAVLVFAPPEVLAASSDGCAGGGYVITGLRDGTTVRPPAGSDRIRTTIPASLLDSTFLVRGKYNEFAVVASTFGIEAYAFTGAENPEDITGGVRTVVFASKSPDHRGLSLTSEVTVDLDGDGIVIDRTGPGLTMKIQAKDCAQGGIFQMEPERGDGTATRITHTLGDGVFYFDNPNFRAREGDVVPYKDTTATVTTRVNFGNDVSHLFVGRDSPQVATRVQEPTCPNEFVSRVRGPEVVQHCGGVSRWNVASGGRMGLVTGGDATEVSPPATACTENCQAQNQVRGQAVNLGFPFPVPEPSRLKPRFP